MSGGAGHIADMNNRLKQNRAQRPSNKAKFKGANRPQVYDQKSPSAQRPIFQQPDEKKLQVILDKIRLQAVKSHKRETMVSFLLLLFTVLALILFFYWIR